MGSGKTYIFAFMKMEKQSQEKYAVWEVRGLLSGLVQVDIRRCHIGYHYAIR